MWRPLEIETGLKRNFSRPPNNFQNLALTSQNPFKIGNVQITKWNYRKQQLIHLNGFDSPIVQDQPWIRDGRFRDLYLSAFDSAYKHENRENATGRNCARNFHFLFQLFEESKRCLNHYFVWTCMIGFRKRKQAKMKLKLRVAQLSRVYAPEKCLRCYFPKWQNGKTENPNAQRKL